MQNSASTSTSHAVEDIEAVGLTESAVEASLMTLTFLPFHATSSSSVTCGDHRSCPMEATLRP
eukprot:CAMPEP_0170337100 /NCGR_PEP_ID=MMETSP0116_2-20130129/69597_1 /TAXON_ID=400756 /ORGANISM="Durinskia baltica, Strain CSIRO CS-38" /LENGTH=62 /DNA_ID=CAMNT_0010590497 /DNA_START=608 /DNA_END=792 /DNA_ORIENTATION=-